MNTTYQKSRACGRDLLGRPLVLMPIAGALAAYGFAPVNLWPLTLVALALLMAATMRASGPWRAFVTGWLFGVGHFTFGNNWIAHAFTYQENMPHWFGYAGVFLLSLYLAVYPGVAALLAWRYRGSTAFVPAFAAAWMLSEYLRATVFTGFAWNPIGVISLDLGIDRVAAWVGSYGLSGLAVIAAAGLACLVARRWRQGAVCLAPLAALGLVGALQPTVPERGPAVRIVQPNVPQDIKNDPEHEEENFARLATLSGRPGAAGRLIFWPEAAVPAHLDIDPAWRGRLAALLGPRDLLLTGGDKLEFRLVDRGGYVDARLTGARNSLWVLTPDARLIGRYDKAHLVPYGEYLPMRPLLGAIGLSRLVPGDIDFWPGPGPRTLRLPAAPGRPALSMGVQICYEIIFSGAVVDPANRPDFLFNPSNDAWFGSWGPPQHLAQARLRAIEEGMPIIRSTPTGISALIAPDGRLLSTIGQGRMGAIEGRLPPPLPPTLFGRIGNLAPAILALAFILLAIALDRASSRLVSIANMRRSR